MNNADYIFCSRYATEKILRNLKKMTRDDPETNNGVVFLV